MDRKVNENGSSIITVGYSNEELEEFRQIILEKLKKAEADYNLHLSLSKGNEESTEETSPDLNRIPFEKDNEISQRGLNHDLAKRQLVFIGHLNNALIRIENGTYGFCYVTGNLISKERLRSTPHATLSVEAKKARDEENRLPHCTRN